MSWKFNYFTKYSVPEWKLKSALNSSLKTPFSFALKSSQTLVNLCQKKAKSKYQNCRFLMSVNKHSIFQIWACNIALKLDFAITMASSSWEEAELRKTRFQLQSALQRARSIVSCFGKLRVVNVLRLRRNTHWHQTAQFWQPSFPCWLRASWERVDCS